VTTPLDEAREALRRAIEADDEIYWAAEYGREIPATSLDAIIAAIRPALAKLEQDDG
jgi:hypothetical protein